MDPIDFTTRSEIDSAIAALNQRRKDLEGQREFSFQDSYCVGGSPHDYVKREPEAMAHLRHELIQGGADPSKVQAASWEELVSEYGWDRGSGSVRFDVTRQGCQSSALFVELL